MNEDALVTISCDKQRIDAFFDAFCLEKNDYGGLLEKYHIDEKTLLPFARWSSDSYQRICLNRNDECELILLCWQADQGTPIHDHDGKKGWIHVVKGVFEEELYSSDLPKRLTEVHQLFPGDSSFLTDDIASHRLVNASGDKAITLHLYSKPVDKCHTFFKDSSESSIRLLAYDFSGDDCE